MKWFFNLFGMALAGVLGYQMEPSLRFQLTGLKPSTTEIASRGKVMLQSPDGASQIDLEKLTPDQLPQRILARTAVKVLDSATGTRMTIDAGSQVKLLRIEGANAVVSPGDGPFEGKIPVTETDLLEQLALAPPAPSTPPVPAPETPPTPVTPPDATPPPAPPVEPAPVEPAVPPVMPEPPPAPEPEATAVEPVAPIPEPPPAPTPIDGPTRIEPIPAAGGDVVKLMQESIKGGQIKEFTFDQVLSWKATDDETVDGESYKTGTASYKAETIFGMKELVAKALIKGGKVQRWIRPKTGLEIK